MASPAAPTTIERGTESGEPAAPTPLLNRSDSFPDVALGIIVPQAAPEEPAGLPAPAASGTETPSLGQPPATGGASGIDWEAVRKAPEYQAEMATALNKQRDRMAVELREAETARARTAELEEAQARWDNLLQQADDESDPIAQEQARAALAQHVRTQRLNEKIEATLRPTLQAQAAQTIATNIRGQYEQGLEAVKDVLGNEVLARIHPDQFESGADWIKAMVGEIGKKAATDAITAYHKDDFEKEVKVRVAQELAKVRGGMPMPDLSEAATGGQNPLGSFSDEESVHDAIASGLITPSRGRAILHDQFGRRFR